MKPPEFKTGNKAVAAALNQVVAYARATGFNPAGRPGYFQTEDGWAPPFITPIGRTRWNIHQVDEEQNLFEVFRPEVRIGNGDIEAYSTIANDSFTPTADFWVVAKITDLDTLAITIEQVETWDGFPSAYEFDGITFEAAYLPLWRFYDADAEGRVQVSEDVYGKKLVPGRTLSVAWSTIAIPGETQYKVVPFFR